MDDLLCLGDSCASKTMNHGLMAIIGVSSALVASLAALFAYQKWGRHQAKKKPVPDMDEEV